MRPTARPGEDRLMFEGALGLGTLLAPAVLAAWWLAGYMVGRLASARTRGRLRLGARLSLAVLALAGILTAAELLMFGVMWSFGWSFVGDRAVAGLPPLLMPAFAALLFSTPRLWGISRGKLADRQVRVNATQRSETTDPLLVVPVQAAAVGAALFLYLFWFPTGVLSPATVLAAWGLSAASCAALWVRQRRRREAGRRSEAAGASRLGLRLLRAVAVLVLAFAAFVGLMAYSARSSELPESFGMMSHGSMDYGGGPELDHGSALPHDGPERDRARGAGHAAHGATHQDGDHSTSVTELAGPRSGAPDRRFTLTARRAEIRLTSGEVVKALTFDGEAPGPELRVREGDLVEVVLINRDVGDGVSLHWHGVDVPNAEDGVAGLTQDAVLPGKRHVYRFRAEQTGTFWYHSHQVSSEQVKKGLFGALVVEPREGVPADEDMVVVAHDWYGDDEFAPATTTFGTSDTLDRRRVAPGKRVRLRLVNTGVYPEEFVLSGTPFEVAAIDGTEIAGPTKIRNQKLVVPAGGRYDVAFTMPQTPVALGLTDERGPRISFSRDGRGEAPRVEPKDEFDPSDYGSPASAPFGASSDFDREFDVVMDNRFGFYDGTFNMLWTINGEVFPDTPTQMVREGDLVKTTFVNRSFMDHPMHLHGHHALVLSRNGEPVTGSPWWVDTLNVAPGETYEVAFRADNPGLWMDHCHNLDHAALGMTMHLAYEGVTTPFEVGGTSGNRPE